MIDHVRTDLISRGRHVHYVDVAVAMGKPVELKPFRPYQYGQSKGRARVLAEATLKRIGQPNEAILRQRMREERITHGPTSDYIKGLS